MSAAFAKSEKSVSLPVINFDNSTISNKLLNTAKPIYVSNKVDDYIKKTYSNYWFRDIVIYNTTPDETAKFNYYSGSTRIIASFSATKNILSYTPIRQLVINPVREAVFDGYYFVSN